MLKSIAIQLLVFPLFLTIVLASIHVTYPVDVTYSTVAKTSTQHGVPNILQSDLLGSVAPGQTVRLIIDRKSNTTFLWDSVELTIPDNWKKTGSKAVSDIEYYITVPQEAQTGVYTITLTASGDIQVLTPEVIALEIDVSNNLYHADVNSLYPVYIDTSNAIPFTVRTDSIAREDTRIILEGVPTNWVDAKKFTLMPGEERRSFFTMEPKSEGVYPAKFKVLNDEGTELASSDSQITVYPASLGAKLKVLNEGFSIVTVVLQPFYSLLSLIGSIF
jgi:hypothetical protein